MTHFKFDVFLSYGWSGLNEQDGDRQWAKAFRNVLQGALSSALGREARIFFDVEQPKVDELDANLRRAIRRSATFVSLISPGSCRKDSWCRKELAEFLRYPTPAAFSPGQLAGVLMNDCPMGDWPEPLQKLAPYVFVDESDPDRPQLPPPVNQWDETGRKVARLAKHLKGVLRESEEEIAKTLFIGAASATQAPMVARLRLEQTIRRRKALDGVCLPGESQAEFAERSWRWLMASGVSVHFATGLGGPVPAGWKEKPLFLQLEAAAERFEGSEGSMIVWGADSGALTPAMVANAQLLPDDRFEYLARCLKDAADAAEAAVSVEAEAVPDGPFVFLDCVKADIEEVLAKVEPVSRAFNIRLKARLFDGHDAARRAKDEQYLPHCRGVAVYFGNRGDLDASDACDWLLRNDSVKKPTVHKGVFVAPANDPVRRIFENPPFKKYPVEGVREFFAAVAGTQ